MPFVIGILRHSRQSQWLLNLDLQEMLLWPLMSDFDSLKACLASWKVADEGLNFLLTAPGTSFPVKVSRVWYKVQLHAFLFLLKGCPKAAHPRNLKLLFSFSFRNILDPECLICGKMIVTDDAMLNFGSVSILFFWILQTFLRSIRQ